jgi:site-specific recombinase XerD
MFLLKRKSVYYVEYLDVEENRVRRVSTHQSIKRDAIKFLSDFEKNLKTQKSYKHIFLDDFEKQYSDYVKDNLSAKYYTSVKLSFRQLISFTGNIPLSKLNYPLMDTFFIETFNRTQHGAWTYYRILKSAFYKAILWGYVDNNPFQKITLPKIPKNNPLFILETELDALLNLEKDELLKSIYLFAFNTGLRLGEIMNLKWNAVDFSDKIICVQNTIDFTTKGKQERKIPMNDNVFNLLVKRLPKVVEIKNDSFVFSYNDIQLNADFISKRFKKIIRISKLSQDLHFHDLRHSFASNLVKKGVSIFVIKELLGHQDVKTTQIYSHLTIDTLHSAVNQLGVNL